MTNGPWAVDVLVEAVKKADLTVVESCYKEFENGGGVTAVVLLLESHVVVHTWPDRNNTVIGDISVCNYSQDNSKKAKTLEKFLAESFLPEKTLQSATFDPILLEDIDLSRGYDVKSVLEVENLLHERRSAYQDIKVVESKNLGKVLILDTVFQTSEKDEFFYHEPLIQVPMLTHPNPENVLIIGGGDGGAAEEVLKHPSVEQCTMIELDNEVIRVAQKYLENIHHNVFDNDRLDLRVEDGFKFLEETRQKFDVIVLDLTDPIGESIPLYSEKFYTIMKDHLGPEGLACLHIGMLTHDPEESVKVFENLNTVFPVTKPYLNYVPIYGGIIGFVLCGASVQLLQPEEVTNRLEKRHITDLQFLNSDTYRSIFALPNYVKNLFKL